MEKNRVTVWLLVADFFKKRKIFIYLVGAFFAGFLAYWGLNKETERFHYSRFINCGSDCQNNQSLSTLQNVSLNTNNTGFLLQKVYNDIAKISIPAVVSIQVEMEVSRRRSVIPHSQEDFLKHFFGYDEIPKKFNQEAFGSGFIISPDGYVISNYHLVENAVKIKVFFKDVSTEYSAKVIGTDPETDIALLKIEEKKEFPFLKMGDSSTTNIGDIVVAIGNPFNLSHTFTTGVISAIGRNGVVQQHKYQNFLQTDVAINRGNSGGPLINLKGEVIGINSAILDSGGGGNIGISFSIPINMAKSIIDELKEKGKVTRGWLGIQYTELSSDVANALGIEKKGIVITLVVEDSPAEKAQLKAGDILLSFNKKEIIHSSDLLNEIVQTPVGKKTPIIYMRNGKKYNSSITLREPKTQTALEEEKADKLSEKYLGLVTHDMDRELMKRYGVDAPFGVVIYKVDPNSPLYQHQITPGNIIESINKKKVSNTKEFEAIAKKIKKGEKVLFKIRHGNAIYYIVVRA